MFDDSDKLSVMKAVIVSKKTRRHRTLLEVQNIFFKSISQKVHLFETIENIPDEGVFEYKIAEEYFFDSIKKENDFNYPDHYQCPSWQLASLSFLEPS